MARLANVLKSKKACQTSVVIVRAFIALKQFAMNYKALAEKINEIEDKYNHGYEPQSIPKFRDGNKFRSTLSLKL